jgi:hypothetical protein
MSPNAPPKAEISDSIRFDESRARPPIHSTRLSPGSPAYDITAAAPSALLVDVFHLSLTAVLRFVNDRRSCIVARAPFPPLIVDHLLL